LFHLAFPTAPVIYLKRNAVDTCLSIWTTPYTTPPEFVYDKGDIAFVYEQHLALMSHWRTSLPIGRIFEMQYEDLVADRESVLARLLEYCGLDWSDACLQHEKNERLVGTPSFWQVRQPVYKTSVDRWKRFEPWLGEFARLIE
jgi:LPS sulfotransferase NodH